MSLRNLDNSSSPRLVSVLNDRSLVTTPTLAGSRVVVLGFCKSEKFDDGTEVVPVQELYPQISGTLTVDQLIDQTRNVSSDATPVKYPSELSIALEELQAAGVENIQVIRIGDETRYRDVNALMVRERYIALEAAYDLIADLPVDHVYPVSVVSGLKGDGRYNNADYEVIYDVELYDELYAIDPNDVKLSMSRISGFVYMDSDSDYEKSTSKTANTDEDPVYQLGNICYTVSTNGSLCSAWARTISPAELKYLGALDVKESTAATGSLDGIITITALDGAAGNVVINVISSGNVTQGGNETITGTLGTIGDPFIIDISETASTETTQAQLATIISTIGVVDTAVAVSGATIVTTGVLTDTVTLSGGTDSEAGNTFGTDAVGSSITEAGKWAFTKTSSTTSIFDDYDFSSAVAGSGFGTGAGKDMTGEQVLEAIEESAYFVDKATNAALGADGTIKAIHQVTTLPVIGVDSATNADVITWGIAYGTPSTSEVTKWVRFLNNFGNGTDAELYEGNIASYLDLDGVTSDKGDKADTFLYFATTDSEKPLANNDATIITDQFENNVDLGKYLRIIAALSVYRAPRAAQALDPVAPKAFTHVAGIGQAYGWINSLESNIAMTRQKTGILGAQAFIGTSAVSQLTRNRYQVFSLRDGVYVFNRDITMGEFVSDSVRTDYINDMTFRIVKDLQDVASAEGEKLLGKGDDPKAREGLKQTLEQEFAAWASPEDGRLQEPAEVEVLSSSVGSVVGAITINLGAKVANEILEIRTNISLRK